MFRDLMFSFSYRNVPIYSEMIADETYDTHSAKHFENTSRKQLPGKLRGAAHVRRHRTSAHGWRMKRWCCACHDVNIYMCVYG